MKRLFQALIFVVLVSFSLAWADVTTTAQVSTFAFLSSIVFSPVFILTLKAVGLPTIIKYALDYPFIKKADLPAKIDLVEWTFAPLRPFVGAGLSLILYVVYSFIVQDPFNANTFSNILVSVGITGGASVWAHNIIENLPTKK